LKDSWVLGASDSSVPTIVFINGKSGGQQGKKLKDTFIFHLGQHQVFDLNEGGPAIGLNQLKNLKNYRLLVAGGDGSVGWVLSFLSSMKISNPVAILPLGTGNDLSRAFGWGPGYVQEPLFPILRNVYFAEEKLLDRWLIKISPENGEAKDYIMNNYFSIGPDAFITLNFHLQREAHPEQFTNRSKNKLWYFYFGLKAMFSEKLPAILEVDGKEYKVPENISGIVVLNLNSFAGGTDLWKQSKGVEDEYKNKFTPQISSDNKIEVIGYTGSSQLGLARSGLSSCKRLAQGNKISIKVTKETACQVDGEPWSQKPCKIDITLLGQANLLVPTKKRGAKSQPKDGKQEELITI